MSWEGKLKNYGFWIFLVLFLIHIPLLFSFFCKGIKSIKEYIINEMKKYGYIKNINNAKTKSPHEVNFPPKKKINKIKSKKKIGKKLIDSSSINNIKYSEREIIGAINISKKGKNIQNNNKNKNKNVNINNAKKIGKKKIGKRIRPIRNKKKILGINKKVKGRILSKKIGKKINILPTQINANETKNNKNDKNIINFNLININLNNIQDYTPKESNHILNNYTFKEAIEYDRRSICATFYIFLLSKQAIFHAFLFFSPLELFSLRLCLLLFIISSDLGLNALFYMEDKISEKYKYAKGLFLFTFNNNITIILLSTFIGFLFMTLFTNLSNSTNALRDVFRKEEEKIQNNKKYKVTPKRKKEILDEIESILKKYKIKVIILLFIELLLFLFFWYYVIIFCHVYQSTQKSWLLDSLLSILSRLIVEILISLGFAKLYRIAVESNVECLYKFVIFFYCFG